MIETDLIASARHGEAAAWEGLVAQHQEAILVWTDGKLTYRLETVLSMTEAVRVAESLGQ